MTQLPSPPTGLLLELTRSRVRRRLAFLDLPDGYLPSPCIRDEPMTPDQQHTVSPINSGDSRPRRGANAAMRKAATPGKLNVCQAYIQPLIFVQGALRNYSPPHWHSGSLSTWPHSSWQQKSGVNRRSKLISGPFSQFSCRYPVSTCLNRAGH